MTKLSHKEYTAEKENILIWVSEHYFGSWREGQKTEAGNSEELGA